MKPFLRCCIFWIVLFFTLHINAVCLPQAANSITAEINKEFLKTSDFLQLIIKIKNNKNSTPAVNLSSIKNFVVIQEARESDVQYARGKVLRCDSFVYLLAPLRAGQLILGPVELTCNGKKVFTEKFVVTVFKKSFFDLASKNCKKKKAFILKEKNLDFRNNKRTEGLKGK